MESLDAAQEPVLGEGPLPGELDRLNWNAFFWGTYWPLAYRIWPWFWGLFALRVAGIVFFFRFNRLTPAPSTASVVAVVATWAALNLGLDVLLALNANRLLWERRGWASNTAPPQSVRAYLATQQRWAKFGIAALVVTYSLGLLDGRISVADRVGTALVPLAILAAWAVDRLRGSRRAS